MIELRRVESDPDYEAWRRVRLAVVPNERAPTLEDLRTRDDPTRLLLVAELDGELAGSGIAQRADTGDGYVTPRVVPRLRGRGVGTALLEPLLTHVAACGFARARAHAVDEASLAFALRRGFEEVDRQVEQIRAVRRGEPWPVPFDGIEFVSVADRPELLEQAYPVACEGHADFAVAGTITVTREAWLREEATLPAGSFVALAGGEIVGYAGLMRWPDDDTHAEHGLTVVRRDWRRRGLATALKRREIAWASANGLRELVTWTQRGNDGMRRTNERLGYVTRDVAITLERPLP